MPKADDNDTTDKKAKGFAIAAFSSLKRYLFIFQIV